MIERATTVELTEDRLSPPMPFASGAPTVIADGSLLERPSATSSHAKRYGAQACPMPERSAVPEEPRMMAQSVRLENAARDGVVVDELATSTATDAPATVFATDCRRAHPAARTARASANGGTVCRRSPPFDRLGRRR